VIGFGAITEQGLDLGWGWSNFGYGLARAGFSFPVGVLLFRLGGRRVRKLGFMALAPMVLLVVAMMAPRAADIRGAVDAGLVLVGFPLLLWWSAALEIPRWLIPTGTLAGDLSYPVYVIHYPVVVLYVAVTRPVDDLRAVGFMALTCVTAFVLLKLYDEPLRKWLTHRFRGGASIVAVERVEP
jgi:peptidoglycan/LPS O-acetylase OafA/YrhL